MIAWFTPHVSHEDAFLPPDFQLGQFFYSADTARRLAEVFDHYASPCCLCTPRLGEEWRRRGKHATVLDIDTRFEHLPGFRKFDLNNPIEIHEVFDVVIFDPVFQSAQTLRRPLDLALAGTTRQNKKPDLFMTFPVAREGEMLAVFQDFNLKPLTFSLSYNNVKESYKNLFRLYGPREPAFSGT